MDAASQRWVQQLRPGHPRRDGAVAALHDVLLRAARHELGRRRAQLGGVAGPEFDDLAQQCANDAMLNVLRRLEDFRGLSRFTTWAYKFAVFEVSAKVARHAWQHQAPAAEEPVWERLAAADRPADAVEQREVLAALARGIAEDLTERQRAVFVAVALNEEPIDVVALRLGSNRNAVYKTLFDARRRLRASLEAVA